MCEKAVDAYLSPLEYVLYWSVSPWMLEIVDNPGLDNLITWCNEYKQRKVCKKEIDKELITGA